MKILILSFYYEPDLCAGSFRCSALTKELSRHNVEIEVITTAPNRYASFESNALDFEQKDNITIHRIALPSHKNGLIDQIRSFRVYYCKALTMVKSNDYDLVYATSSRLFTAFLGARIANKKKLPLYLDIRDIFVDTVDNILPRTASWLVKPILSHIERYTFNSANRINLVSKGFLKYFKCRYNNSLFRFFTNGIDEEFMDKVPIDYVEHNTLSVINVLYVGNIGEGQGLHKVIPELAKRLNTKFHFKIIGDGGQKQHLKNSIAHFNLINVELLPPVNRSYLIEEYKKADILFLHLNDYPAFEKVLPSKLFEYAATGKPIWAGLAGYSAQFVQSEIDNCQVFTPCNTTDAINKLDDIYLGIKSRIEFKKKFRRIDIMNSMASDIIELVKHNG